MGGGGVSILEFLKERGDLNAYQYVACGEYGYFVVSFS